MAVYIRKHPLEIPLPSEKDWLKDDEEDFFLQDPERERDALPQPVRMVTKLVMLVFDDAMEIIERRESLREAEKLKVKPTECFATAEFQVTGTATCLAVSGKYIFVGLSVGLAVFKVSDYTKVCAWDAVKTEICAIHALDLGNESHILFAVDEMGLAYLFCFHKECFLLIKILNEVESAVAANKVDIKLSLPVLLLIVKPPKPITDSDLNPDVVWPCAAPIVCSAVSSCSRYLALACEDAAITIWDKQLGYPLSVTTILEERLIRSIHFLRSSAVASDETPCPGTDPACPIVQLLVLCTDSALYLVRAPRSEKSSITLLANSLLVHVKYMDSGKSLNLFYRPQDPNLAVSAVVPVLAFPSAVLVFSWDGKVSLMNTDTSQIVFCFIIPPSHSVASPWQPVFTVDSVNWCLLLRGDKQQQADALASCSTIFLFDFNSYPLKKAFPQEPDLPLKSSQNLTWFERCNVFLRDRQQSLLGLREQLPEFWSRLQAQAAAMDEERQEKKGQKKPS
ncbi:WD repeat-containing protein 93-like protein [Amazona aestiva]|uniref:WD repeat-containing protein 93-like protein n=1 Tax=Amazona aestiva TaxID=12930 RepID=A0A0Q3TZS7_AMAAE|nr:WD repeat-containing protein 93-like protein [Amazona aestiva]